MGKIFVNFVYGEGITPKVYKEHCPTTHLQNNPDFKSKVSDKPPRDTQMIAYVLNIHSLENE